MQANKLVFSPKQRPGCASVKSTFHKEPDKLQTITGQIHDDEG
jgi:hypothetical protein